VSNWINSVCSCCGIPQRVAADSVKAPARGELTE
jgi:hypothetical protein